MKYGTERMASQGHRNKSSYSSVVGMSRGRKPVLILIGQRIRRIHHERKYREGRTHPARRVTNEREEENRKPIKVEQIVHVTNTMLRGHSQMMSAERGGRGITQNQVGQKS